MLTDPSPNKFQFKSFIFCWILWHSPFNGNLSIKIQHVTRAKIFLCSFKFRQLVLLCQTNRFKNPDQIFYRFFLNFYKPFCWGQRIHGTHFVGNLESDTCFQKVIRAFGFHTCKIKSSLKFLNPSFVEKSFVQKWSKHFMKLKQVPNLNLVKPIRFAVIFDRVKTFVNVSDGKAFCFMTRRPDESLLIAIVSALKASYFIVSHQRNSTCSRNFLRSVRSNSLCCIRISQLPLIWCA